MARGEEVHAVLAGHRGAALGGLARQEAVQAELDRRGQVVGRRAAADPEAADGVGAVQERDDVLAQGHLGHAPHKLGGRDSGSAERRGHADGRAGVRERGRPAFRPQRRGQAGVVAVDGMGVQRQVVGRQGDVALQQQLQPAVSDRVETEWLAAPEQAVMH